MEVIWGILRSEILCHQTLLAPGVKLASWVDMDVTRFESEPASLMRELGTLTTRPIATSLHHGMQQFTSENNQEYLQRQVKINLDKHFLLRSAVGMTHVLR